MPASIRTATHRDRDAIREVHLNAFPATENQLVATLAINLLDQDSDSEAIALVAEIDGRVVGHIAFSHVMAQTGRHWLGYILAPLGVRPEHHGKGIGSQLIRRGLELLTEKQVDTVFVYGDPDYYARFGFSADAARHFMPPYPLTHPHGWQAKVLHGKAPNGQPVRLSCVPPLHDPALW